MKINRPSDKKLKEQLDRWKSLSGKSKSADDDLSTESRASFKDSITDQKIELLDMEVHDLVSEIGQRGDALLKHPTMGQFRQYKQALASFLKKSLDLSKTIRRIEGKRTLKHIEGGQEPKVHVIVETMDEKLSELSTTLLKREKGRVETAELVAEIKGLVVNLVDTVEAQREGKSE